MTCACCRRFAPPVALIPRDGHELGPLVPLCANCSALPLPEVWQKVAQPSAHANAFKPVRSFRFPQDAPREVSAS